ncbi:MAG: hypothetical protein JW706_05315 [Opitutales bacterium]|nr:hypothetical protein [Opitutales bacterium]
MKTALKWISLLALVAVILPPFLYFKGSVSKPMMSGIMLAGTVLWFATAPFWMGRRQEE